jgi:predicted permease
MSRRQSREGAPAGGGERLYAALLHLYPAAFRRRFAGSMRFAFTAEARSARSRGRAALSWLWVRTIAHVLWLSAVERFTAMGRSAGGLGGAFRNVGYAARRLRRSPGFTAAAAGTLALGIGATTAIFSLVYSVVLNPLPYPHPDRLVAVQHTAEGAGLPIMGVSLGTFVHYREYNRSFEELTVYTPTSFAVLGDAGAERVPGATVAQGFFEIFLGGPPTLGRTFTDADQEPGAPPVAVIGTELWRSRFDGDPDIVGRSISIDGTPTEVIGVLPAAFDVPADTTRIWLPARIDPQEVILGGFGGAGAARLLPGVTPAQARADLERLIPTLAERFNPVAFDLLVTGGGLSSVVVPLRDSVVGGVEQMLWIVLGTVGLVLAVACANVANLMLVRAEAGRREVAIRRALGAGRAHILGHHLAESIVLCVLGGCGGLLLAILAVRWVVAWGPRTIPRLHEVGIHPPVVLFAAAVAAVTAIAFSVVPLLRPRVGTAATIADGGRGATGSRRRVRARDALVISQISLALILLVGAALMVRTFSNLRAVERGFEADGALVFQVGLPQALYPDRTQAYRFQQRIIERMSELPGVAVVGAGACIPFDNCRRQTPVYAEYVSFDPNETPPSVDVRGATEGYFDALGIPLVEGRTLESSDPYRQPAAAVVSANLAARLWPGESAVGKRIYPDVPEEDPYTIVGVVADHLAYGLAEPAPEFLFVSYLGPYGYVASPHTLTFIVRTDVPPLELAPAVRETLRELDADVPIANLQTLQEVADQASAPTAFAMILLVTAGTMALVLGAIGVYGVLSYLVAQRTAEIGIRMALGARAGDVGRMVMGRGVGVAVVGLVVGLAGAMALSRLMTAVLFGVAPGDPLAYTVSAAVLGTVALLATWLPARRASRVDPIVALRAR